jgi:hypothetical protein
MIPTRFRSKLPRHLSYPVGAEAISEALAGAPHFDSLSVAFNDGAVWPASGFRRLLAEKLPYVIIKAAFSPARGPGLTGAAFMIEKGSYDEQWELHVYPILSEFRSVANRLLREQGLPAIANWLRSSDHAGWRTVPRRVELVFGPADGSLAVREWYGV